MRAQVGRLSAVQPQRPHPVLVAAQSQQSRDGRLDHGARREEAGGQRAGRLLLLKIAVAEHIEGVLVDGGVHCVRQRPRRVFLYSIIASVAQ